MTGGTLQLAIGEVAVSTHTPEFSRVFEEQHGMVFRTAYRITGNAADAEDVLQTIFLRMLRRSSSEANIDKQESYLRRAAVNASLDLLRARHSEQRIPLAEATGRGEGSPLELKECLRRAFVRLTPRSAEVFVLRHIEGLNNRQIAESLKISQVLVAVTLHRTRRQLQKEIRSYFGGRL